MPNRRTFLKVVHWITVPLFIWFLFVTPTDVARIGANAVWLHSVFGLIFVSLALVWTFFYLTHGLLSRPGPKLKGWMRQFHGKVHRILVWGLFGVALTGFLLGLTSSRLLFAGDILPIAPPLNMPSANDVVGVLHIFEFYGLALVVVLHAGFHIWRHVKLRDNALRIMAPRILHRFL